jgi:acetyltransferase-like isoleucine patch superfamily enzyme
VPRRDDELTLLRPGIAARSAYLSMRYGRGSRTRFPIRAARSARMWVADDAEVRLGGRLVLGLSPELDARSEVDFEPKTTQRSNVIVRSQGTFETKGWAVIGPGAQVIVAPGGKVTLGKGHICSVDSTVICKGEVSFGDDGGISWGVLVIDSNFHPMFVDEQPVTETKPITVGDHVYVGARSILLKGTNIGSGSIIAAGSIVTGDIPPNVMAGGAPAKVLRKNVRWVM